MNKGTEKVIDGSSQNNENTKEKEHIVLYEKYLKDIFSNPETVKNFFEFVPYNFVNYLNFRLMTILSSDHINARLKKAMNDSVWKIRFKDSELFLCSIIEFQSYVDDKLPFRLGRLRSDVAEEFVEIDNRYIEEFGHPFIFPAIIYIGTTPWNFKNISELYSTNSEKDYCKEYGFNFIPSYDVFFLNVREIPMETLKEKKGFFSLYVRLLRAQHLEEFCAAWYEYKEELIAPENISTFKGFVSTAKMLLIEYYPNFKNKIESLNTFDEIGGFMF